MLISGFHSGQWQWESDDAMIQYLVIQLPNEFLLYNSVANLSEYYLADSN